ncbi:MAG TPA: DinB family protein [Dehalococcoidia bacterium]|nr:DinB family protein [Dehalococcoidia bacterium]
MIATGTGFERHWAHITEMVTQFVDAVPDEHWMFSPHPRFAPFAMQLRHIVRVRRVYADGIRNRRVDMARKRAHYAGDLSRAALSRALTETDGEILEAVLDAAEDPGAQVDFINRAFPLFEFTYVIVQHDAIHLGEWSLYATLAGFETPLAWRLGWGL